METRIGTGASINSHTVIYAGNRIGRNFRAGHHVLIRELNEIGDDVSIGSGSNVEHHVRIGHGVRLHSNVFVPELEKRMNVKVIIPPNYDVGNAVGAVCSKVSETIAVQVYPRDFKFWIFSPFTDPLEFHHREEAIEKAMEIAGEYVRVRALAAGAKNVEVMVDVDEKRFAPGSSTSTPTSNWTEVRARATGDPL
jgi:NDP-sugar pyrophosphorylase family protein